MNMEDTSKNKTSKEEKAISESTIAMFYDLIQNWMRPSPNHPTFLKVLIFIIKLPVLLIVLALSPVLLLIMFLTLVVAV
jgi:hypothetical protein